MKINHDPALLKRSGGATQLTLPWRLTDATQPEKGATTLDNSPMQLLADLHNTFASDTSRKAAYLTQGWLPNLPSRTQMPADELQALLAASLAYQFKRQGAKVEADSLAGKLAAVAMAPRLANTCPADTVRDVLAVAEFLAREGRSQKERRV